MTQVQGPVQRLSKIISHLNDLELEEMLQETPSEQVALFFEKTWMWNMQGSFKLNVFEDKYWNAEGT